MIPGAAPAAPAAPAPPNAGETWATLVADAALPHHSIGHALSCTEADKPWSTGLATLTAVAARAPDVNVANLILEYAAAITPTYFLTIIENRVEVVHSLRQCYEVGGGGARVLALVGERKLRSTSLEMPPKLHTLGGALNQQAARGFERVNILSPPLADIKTEMDANPIVSFVPPLVALDPANPPPEVSAFKTLPVPPMIACLFLRGLQIREAVTLVSRIIQAVPLESRDETAELDAFIRVAATSNNDTSLLASTWRVIDTTTNERLETWYYTLLDQLPRAPTILPPPPPVPLPIAPSVPLNNNPGALMQALVDSIARSNEARDVTARQGSDYSRFLLNRILVLTDAPRPFSGLGEEYLPPAFVQLKPFKGKTAMARGFLENYLRENYPSDRETYPLRLTTELVRAIREVDFIGRDELCSFANRHQGISFFSLAPADEFGDDAATRAEMVAYEETVHNHTPAEARRMATLQANQATVPSDRLGVRAWVDHTDIILTMLFTPQCRCLPALKDVLVSLRSPVIFRFWSVDNFRALVWRLHIGLRAFMSPTGDTLILETVAHSLKTHQAISTDGLPAEMRAVPPPARAPNPAPNAPPAHQNRRQLGAPPGFEQQQHPQRQRLDPAGPTFVGRWTPDLDRAAAAIAPRRLVGNDIARGASAIRTLFGPEFCALVENGASPCMKMMLFGSCNIPRCTNGHRLSSPPTPAILAGIQTRVQTRCAQIIREHPNA